MRGGGVWRKGGAYPLIFLQLNLETTKNETINIITPFYLVALVSQGAFNNSHFWGF